MKLRFETSSFDLTHSLVQLNMLCPQFHCKCNQCLLHDLRLFRPPAIFRKTQHISPVLIDNIVQPVDLKVQSDRYVRLVQLKQSIALLIAVRFAALLVFDDRELSIWFGDFTLPLNWERKLFLTVCIAISVTQFFVLKAAVLLVKNPKYYAWIQLIEGVHSQIAAHAFIILRGFAFFSTKMMYPCILVFAWIHLKYYSVSSLEQQVVYAIALIPGFCSVNNLSNFVIRRTNYIAFVFDELIKRHVRMIRSANNRLWQSIRSNQVSATNLSTTGQANVHAAIDRMCRTLLQTKQHNLFWKYPLGILYFYAISSNALILLMAFFIQDPFMRSMVLGYAPIQFFSCVFMPSNSVARLLRHRYRYVGQWVSGLAQQTSIRTKYRLFTLIELLDCEHNSFSVLDIAPVQRSMVILVVLETISNGVLFIKLFAKF